LAKLKSPPYCQDLAVPLASLIVAHLRLRNYQKALFQLSPVLVPIPLHRKRERERGFNQSLLLAKRLAQEFSLPIRCHWLQRQKSTLSQEGLNLKERQENLEGAFYCPFPELVTGQRIILIDDVFTSGATMKEAALVLKNKGASFVWGITIARHDFSSQ
jgi:ComF family protein